MIVNAMIHTMDEAGTVIENGYIEFSGGVISEVGEMSSLERIPEDSWDAQGRDIWPGLIDAHTHLGLFEDSTGFEGSDGNEDTDPVTPQLRAIDGINPFDKYFTEALHSGITTVLVSPGSANPVSGQIAAIKTYGKRIDKMILRSPAAVKFSLGENPKSTYNDKDETPVTRMAVAALIRETLYKAKKYYNDKQLYASDSENYDEPEYDLKNESLLPLFSGKAEAHFHAHRADDIFTALRISAEFGLRCVIVHGTEAHLISDELRGECLGILSGPFLTDRSKPELSNLTPTSPGLLADAGLPVAIITDHPETPINYLTLCMAIAVREGMDEASAIRAVTSTAASICGISDRVGSIVPGKDADLVVYDGSLLDITRKPYAVFAGGVRVI